MIDIVVMCRVRFESKSSGGGMENQTSGHRVRVLDHYHSQDWDGRLEDQAPIRTWTSHWGLHSTDENFFVCRIYILSCITEFGHSVIIHNPCDWDSAPDPAGELMTLPKPLSQNWKSRSVDALVPPYSSALAIPLPLTLHC